MRTTGLTKRGFTLIEVIIVVIILGILAAIALPKVVENVDRARGAEAMQTLGNMGRALDHCLAADAGGTAVVAGNVTNCNTFALIGMGNPSNQNFTYTITAPSGTLIGMRAAWKGAGAVAADVIAYTFDGAGDATTETGCSGKFAKLCR